ncbi:MAG: tetratricopeptide repeat protein [Deltaproteobacteria bacterium]
MIEATCAACGTVNRIAEADVPLGAKFVACSSCKSRVMLPASALARSMTSKVPIIPAPAIPKIPAPAKPAELADLPAPKRQGPLAGLEASKPAPKSGLDLVDLPAPKMDLPDLPAPKSGISSGITDLPAPKAKSVLPPRATPPKGSGIADLPAPKAKTPGAFDLPAPKPRAATPPAPMPAVKPAVELDIVDLPAPKGITDLPAPKDGGVDLPAPKGFFDDLPQPARQKPGNSDLPAPKGFFDDLPQPAKHQSGLPVPIGSAAPSSADLLAPKGFFDDLPQPARAETPAPPAPKGFFDDLPQPSGKPPTVPPPMQSTKATPPALPAKAAPAGGTGVFDDLPEPMGGGELSGTDLLGGFSHGDLDLGPGTGPGLELDTGGGDHAELDLGLPSPSSSASPNRGDFADLDLSSPTAPPAPQIKTGISIKPTTSKSSTAKASSASSAFDPGGKSASEIRLDLEDDGKAPPQQPGLVTPKRRDAAKKQAAGPSAEAKAKSAKLRKILLGAVLGLALVGSGGAFFYKRYADKQARAAEVAEHVKAARAAIHGDNPNHWTRASSEAGEALQRDPKNIDAIGLQAEALLGGALDTGIGGDTRIAAGRKKLADALEAGVTGPQLDGAQALGMIASNQADRAIQKLQTMTQREPQNGFWLLYLGWAQAAKGDPASAVKSFDAALAADPKVKLPVLYARGKAKLQLNDLAGAKADFAAVLELAKDHIGAQVGLAAAMPAAESSRREAELLGILARKDIGTGDPRAVVQAWTLAAEVARVGGRLDVARERYHKALELAKLDVPALVGLARVELRDNKLAVAQDLVQKALSQAADNVDAQLVAADLDIAQGKLADANAIATKLGARTPPLPPAQQAQLDLVLGNVLEAQGNEDGAIEAWTAGAKLAGDTDLAPMMSAVTKLGELAKKAADNKDAAKAADYRARADALLQSLADRAQEDAQLSKALGAAYLGADDPAKAEKFLRRAVEMKTDDIETHLELAKALSKLDRVEDALEQLEAAQQLDPSRADIALEIARTYEDAKRDADALAAYQKLLSIKDPPIQARVRAGRFLARKGDIKGAAEQGDLILKAEPDNAAGHYLKGVGLIAANRLDEARKELLVAVDGDPDPQYLDAEGTAAELSVAASSDTKYYDLALRAYERAIAAAPEMFNPQAGTGRVYVARKDWTKAITPLLAANRIKPDDAEVMYNIGLSYKNIGQSKVAAEWLQHAVAKKRDADTYYQLAQLYLDANNPNALTALREATHLGQEKETKLGVKVPWLTEAYHQLAQTEYGNHNPAGAKAAFEAYVGRSPAPGAALDDARRLLSTELRGQ